MKLKLGLFLFALLSISEAAIPQSKLPRVYPGETDKESENIEVIDVLGARIKRGSNLDPDSVANREILDGDKVRQFGSQTLSDAVFSVSPANNTRLNRHPLCH